MRNSGLAALANADDFLAFVQENVHHRVGLFEEPTRVAAKVEHDALSAFGGEACEGLTHFG